MANFLKGILGGIGNIVPGLSGSALLVILGIYQESINAITELIKFKNIKKNILFLMPIGLGVIFGTILFGNILLFLLEEYSMPTSFSFIGFILGTIPLLFKEANKEGFNFKFLIPMVITLVIGIVLLNLKDYNGVQAEALTFIEKMALGFVLAASTIIPGISSTVLLSLLGFYDFYLTAIAHVDIIELFPVVIGLCIGAIIFVLLMHFLLKKLYGYTYYAVSGFCIATIPAVLRGKVGFDLITFISIVCAISAFAMTYMVSKKSCK